MYDEPTQYFKNNFGYDDSTPDTSDYYYSGNSYAGAPTYQPSSATYGAVYDYPRQYQYQQNQYRNVPSDSRRYINNSESKYIPPYNPHTQSAPQDYRYPQTYRDPHVNSYDYYESRQMYMNRNQDPFVSKQALEQTIPPYEPGNESRRNDRVGLLNSDLFRSKEGYSNPITQTYEKKYVPPTNTVYSKENPIAGGFCNNYTRPPVPGNPCINWSQCLSKDEPKQEPHYTYEPRSQEVPRFEEKESWYDRAVANFSEENL